jgi:hypothetical protein
MGPSIDETLERTQWDFFWIPEEVAIVDRPEIAYLHTPRDLTVFNQVVRTHAQPARLPELVGEVCQAHAGVRSRWLVPSTIPRVPLEEALDAAGYRPVCHHHACAIAVEDYVPHPAPGITVHSVDGMQRLRDAVAVAESAFAEDRPFTEEDLRRQLHDCTRADRRVHRFVAYDDASGEPISSGGMSAFPDLRFGFLWAGGTVPAARGRGAYSAIVEARVKRARECGLSHVGLYAMVDTSAPVVARQGFARHGTMAFWERA